MVPTTARRFLPAVVFTAVVFTAVFRVAGGIGGDSNQKDLICKVDSVYSESSKRPREKNLPVELGLQRELTG